MFAVDIVEDVVVVVVVVVKGSLSTICIVIFFPSPREARRDSSVSDIHCKGGNEGWTHL